MAPIWPKSATWHDVSFDYIRYAPRSWLNSGIGVGLLPYEEALTMRSAPSRDGDVTKYHNWNYSGLMPRSDVKRVVVTMIHMSASRLARANCDDGNDRRKFK